ncbi:MAG: D-aminoacyl-tRNA deacylase [Desulfovermiculus sp.]
MRIVLQRVKKARLVVQDLEKASIATGLVVLIGFSRDDELDLPHTFIWSKLLDKIVSLRIFPDHKGRSEASLKDINGSLLVISQFTLYADWNKGRRPSFTPAAPPQRAQALYDHFIHDLTRLAPGRVFSGFFGQEMDIELCNWGPFTLTLDSNHLSG